MKETPEITSERKKDHLDVCLNEDAEFQNKNNGFEKYHFEHYAITEVDYSKMDLTTAFLDKEISFPFLISCMTGGVKESITINEKLAEIAEELKIAIGVGSQRQALEDDSYIDSYKAFRKMAPNVPLLGNIGAGEVACSSDIVGMGNRLIDMIEADALVIHFNPLQELFQKEGDTDFTGLLNNIEKLCGRIETPIIAKEVGSGIGKAAAKKLLEAGVKGIDVAGSGGTSWAAVEMIRNKNRNEYFWDWGIPTAECIIGVKKLKKKYKFDLIASGGIKNGIDVAKSLALGSDIVASANVILKHLVINSEEGVIDLIENWFEDVKRIMFLTGCANLNEFKTNKLKRGD
ncbi:MAG: type 2 isopentenyl-diphosphate Delta-isomerase [Bacteroidetes bacterium]|nr:type 2 isopentenyl-diphosphate Delta-isomerase [Bacteroidota bacterium]